MNHLPENERLGAYLDGELTAAERAEVERLLAADPSARQLVEELRTLRTTLQELPPLSIGRSIRNEVLGRVEQPKATLAPRPTDGDATETRSSWRAMAGRMFQARALIWSGVAVAVAVLIWVMEPGRRDDRLAMTEAAPEATPSMRAYDDAEATGMAIKEEPYLARKALPEAMVAESGPAAPRAAERAESDTSGMADMPSSGETRGRGVGQLAEQPAPAAPEPLALPARAAPVDRVEKPDDAKPSEVAESLLVVRCDVTAEAARERLFERLLESRQIARSEPRESQERFADAPAAGFAKRSAANGVEAEPGGEVWFEAEATLGDVVALVGELEKRPEQFSRLSYAYLPQTSAGSFGGAFRGAGQRFGAAEAADERGDAADVAEAEAAPSSALPFQYQGLPELPPKAEVGAEAERLSRGESAARSMGRRPTLLSVPRQRIQPAPRQDGVPEATAALDDLERALSEAAADEEEPSGRIRVRFVLNVVADETPGVAGSKPPAAPPAEAAAVEAGAPAAEAQAAPADGPE